MPVPNTAPAYPDSRTSIPKAGNSQNGMIPRSIDGIIILILFYFDFVFGDCLSFSHNSQSAFRAEPRY